MIYKVLGVIAALILVFAILLIIHKRRQGAGSVGERMVAKCLKRTLGSRATIRNGYFLLSGKKTLEMDHVAVCRKGVLVVETKNYSGGISGRASEEYWVQTLAGGKVKNELYNPLLQNETHCRFIKKMVGEGVPVISLVVFVQDNVKRGAIAENVMGLSDLPVYIRAVPDRLNKRQVSEIGERVRKNDSSGRLMKRKHQRYIARMRRAMDRGVCPRCGKKLTKGKEKGFSVYRCSDYPKCGFYKRDFSDK